MDTTRAEVLFARGVILVEGPSELFVVSAAAEDMGKALDEYGITVCSVHGTDFAPYAKLLGPRGLDIPFVVLTDGDWHISKGEKLSRGLRRIVSIATAMDRPESDDLSEMYESRQWDELRNAGKKVGIFVGDHTLEVDLFNYWHGPELVESLQELGLSRKGTTALENLAERNTKLTNKEAKRLLKTIERFGKGRVAQRLASRIDSQRIPSYITGGVHRITEALSR